MKISLLQPNIIRGDIEHNTAVVQRLVNKSKGQLLVLPEYGLTGSLTLDQDADIHEWARKSEEAETRLQIPEGKFLLINSLSEINGNIYNCSKLLPTNKHYCKLFPDETERKAGILPGTEQTLFELSGKRFKVFICYDLPNIQTIATDNLDFLLFIYHFTESNHLRVLQEIRAVSLERNLPVITSSLVSDKNNGYSCFIDGDRVMVHLSDQEGILEVEI